MYKYRFIIVPVIAIIICQILKFIIESIMNKKLMVGRIFNGSGGFPSSHTTFSVTLVSLLGMEFGIDSPIFAVALIFSLIVMYDAVGVRYESGKQASIINQIVAHLNEHEFKKSFELLKEQVGHKPFEVLAGIVLGILVSIIFDKFIF